MMIVCEQGNKLHMCILNTYENIQNTLFYYGSLIEHNILYSSKF